MIIYNTYQEHVIIQKKDFSWITLFNEIKELY